MIVIIQSVIVPVTYQEILAGIYSLFNSKNRLAEFETMLSELVDCEYVILTSSGTSALYVLLKAYGLKRGDEIIVPAYICEKVVRLLLDMGYKVKFVDVEKETYDISIEDLNEKISRETKVVIAAHMFGNPCRMDEILEVSHDHNAIVIEDSAQCICAEYKGKRVGSLGDSAFFSFGEGKPITTISGGAITTNDKEVAKKAMDIVNKFKRTNNKILLKLILYSFIKNRRIYRLVYNKIQKRRERRWNELKNAMNLDDLEQKFTNLQASIGIIQLKKLRYFNEARYRNSTFLIRGLERFKNIRTPKILPNCKPIFLRLPIYIKDINLKQRLLKALIKSGIDASPAYPNYLPNFFKINHDCPNARDLVRKTITLPVHPCVKQKDLIGILDIVRRVAE